MGLLIAMLPVYLLANLHCLGMCGPLALLLGSHPYRHLYFLGRVMSFTLAATLSGEAGAVLNQMLRAYQIPAVASFVFGGVILVIAIQGFVGFSIPGTGPMRRLLSLVEQRLAMLVGNQHPLSAFCFGFFTVALPCGQTLLVFSACALSGSAWVGMINGLAFALLTTPSLWLAMHARGLMNRLKSHYNSVMGVLALLVAALAICRGLAEIGTIPHLVLNPSAANQYHVILY